MLCRNFIYNYHCVVLYVIPDSLVRIFSVFHWIWPTLKIYRLYKVRFFYLYSKWKIHRVNSQKYGWYISLVLLSSSLCPFVRMFWLSGLQFVRKEKTTISSVSTSFIFNRAVTSSAVVVVVVVSINFIRSQPNEREIVKNCNKLNEDEKFVRTFVWVEFNQPW